MDDLDRGVTLGWVVLELRGDEEEEAKFIVEEAHGATRPVEPYLEHCIDCHSLGLGYGSTAANQPVMQTGPVGEEWPSDRRSLNCAAWEDKPKNPKKS